MISTQNYHTGVSLGGCVCVCEGGEGGGGVEGVRTHPS